MDHQIDRTMAAQAADEMLTISGTAAAFVLFPDGATVILSGRSLGEFNVQAICERMGGGGHQAMAGAQIVNSTVQVVQKTLEDILAEYFD
jgi:c-di-AMP phosphodiesterase-like protein